MCPFGNVVVIWVTGHNGHKAKRPQPKHQKTETATNWNAHNRNGHRPKWPQTERPQTETATNQIGHKPELPHEISYPRSHSR